MNSSLNETMIFVSHLKSKLFELQKFDLNFLMESSAGEILLSNIVRSKLFTPFLKELCRKVQNNYPSVKVILDNATSIQKLVMPREKPQTTYSKEKPQMTYSKEKPQIAHSGEKQFTHCKQGTGNMGKTYTYVSNGSNEKSAASTLSPRLEFKGCRFCFMDNHSSLHCKKYYNHHLRTKRAIELNLCSRCLSSKHNDVKCPGNWGKLPYPCKSCLTLEHVTPLCPSMVLSLSSAKTVKNDGSSR